MVIFWQTKYYLPLTSPETSLLSNTFCFKYSASLQSKCKRTTGGLQRKWQNTCCTGHFSWRVLYIKPHYLYDTTVFWSRTSADSQVVLPLHLTTGLESGLSAVEAAAENGNGCSLWFASDWNKAGGQKSVLWSQGKPYDRPQEGEQQGQFHMVYEVNFQNRHKSKKLWQNIHLVWNWCCLSLK